MVRGTLIDWDGVRGCGWIADFQGRRYFAHKGEFTQQFPYWTAPCSGIVCEFTLGADNRERAERITVVKKEQSHSFVGPPKEHLHSFGAPRQSSARFRGIIARWDAERACGNIEKLDQPGRCYFAHKTEFVTAFADNAPPAEGSPVTFAVGIDARSQKERAVSIRFLEEDPAFNQQAALALIPEMSTGTLVDWQLAKAFGYIESPQFPGRRIFAHKTEFAQPFEDDAPPQTGVPCTFVLSTDSRSGKERASQIMLGEVAEAALLAAQQPVQGTLVEWKAQSACGFIELDDPPGGRLFCHKSEFVVPFDDDASPMLSSRLEFTMGFDQKSGKKRAVNIINVSGAFNAPAAKRAKTDVEFENALRTHGIPLNF